MWKSVICHKFQPWSKFRIIRKRKPQFFENYQNMVYKTNKNKDKNKFDRMIKRVVSVVESGEIFPLPKIPILPKNIAPGDRPNKEEVSCNQKS